MGPTFFCWSCRARVDVDSGSCRHCGGRIEPPPAADYVDRLIWALGHPLVERRLVAARLLGERCEARATAPLRDLAEHSDDPYLAAVAVESVVAIVGVDASRALLRRIASTGAAPVRGIVADLLALGHSHPPGEEVR